MQPLLMQPLVVVVVVAVPVLCADCGNIVTKVGG